MADYENVVWLDVIVYIDIKLWRLRKNTKSTVLKDEGLTKISKYRWSELDIGVYSCCFQNIQRIN